MSTTKGQKMTSKFTSFSSDEEPADRKSTNSSYVLKDVENALPQLSTASINVEFVEDPDWPGFEFITKKKGAYGPTKEDCKNYYPDRFACSDACRSDCAKSSRGRFHFIRRPWLGTRQVRLLENHWPWWSYRPGGRIPRFFRYRSYNHELHITVSDNGQMFKWIEPWVLFDVPKNGFQTLTIPISAEYKIELVAPGSSAWPFHPGVRIIGKFELKKGDKITAALGQQGNDGRCGNGGSFLVLESDGGQKPLLIAGGAGSTFYGDEEFGRGNIKQAAIGNENVGTSGKQKIFYGDKEDIYCAGAGYYEAPKVSNLTSECVAPKSYKNGLTGGKRVYWNGDVAEGGFGGGGGTTCTLVNGRQKFYYGAGGGFTGGSTKVDGRFHVDHCCGGGGGSFSADPEAEFDHHYVEYGYCIIKKL